MKRFLLLHALALLLPALFAEGEPRTITVDEAVEYARNYSRTIRSAAIDVDSKGDARNHALNAFLPDISFSGSLARPNEYDSTNAKLLNPLYNAHGMGNPIPTDYESKAASWNAIGSASISLNWGLSIIEKVKKSNRDYEAGVISWEQTVRQNERDIRKLFYSLLLQQKSLENDRATLETTKARYESTDKKYKSGATARFDVLQSRVTYQNMKRDVDNAAIALSRQMREFAVILGFSPDTPIALSGALETEIVPIDREKLLAAYSAYSDDIRLLETQIASLDSQMRGLNFDSWTPTLSFNYATKPTLAGIDKDWFDGSNWHDKGNLSMSLTWSFTNALPFSNNRIKYHDLERQKEQLKLKLEQKKDDIMLDSAKLFDELETSAATLASCRENIELAEESYTLVSRAYNAGSADLIEVRDAETQLNKSRLAEQSELYTYQCALIDLAYMLDLPDGWNK